MKLFTSNFFAFIFALILVSPLFSQESPLIITIDDLYEDWTNTDTEEKILSAEELLSQETQTIKTEEQSDTEQKIQIIFEEKNSPPAEEITKDEIAEQKIADEQDINEEVTIPLPQKKTLEIAGLEHELTQKYVNQYLTDHGRKWLCSALEDSIPYRPYIRKKLKENNLPQILQYLPIVESNYKVTAVSRSGATGIWQFMENSMAPLLKKSSWYDDRRDPWKSTDAAVKKLAYNYTLFNDWAFAIGAYNCGAGAMKKIINRNPGKDFWELAKNGTIRSQTANYVPKLLAIAEIVENAEYYGLLDIGLADKLTPEEVEEYDYIDVAGMLSLNQIAQLTQIERSTIKFLNPGLFRNCTPAREVYSLRLPKGTGKNAEEALKEHGVPTDAITYKVVQGDSLWGISRKYGLTVADLCEVNGIKEKAILSIGQTLIVPIFKE